MLLSLCASTGNAQMLAAYFKNISLKTKVSLTVTLLFFLFVTSASYLALLYSEQKFKEYIFTQQFSLVTCLANNIDDKLRIAQDALIAVAATVPEDCLTDPDLGQAFLDRQTGIMSIFDNGIFLLSYQGRLIAESPYLPNRRGRDISFRDFHRITVATGKPFISDPYVSTHNPGHPAINVTAPIFDKQGKMVAMLTGSLDLQGENFLAELSKVKIGKAGYHFLIANNRTLIVHPDKSRIMNPVAAPGVNQLIDRALRGFEGSGETVTSYGIPMLTSIKRLRMTSWILGANFPASEAFATLNTTKHYFGLATLLASSILLLVSWLATRRLMSPLAAMTRHVEHLQEKTGTARQIKIISADKVGVLATAFNTMVDTLDRQHESMKERIHLAVAEIRQKDQMLIQQGRFVAMGEMFNNIAHQWRQPLNNIGLILQNIQLGCEDGEIDAKVLNKELESAMEVVMHMSHTIDDFRNFFRQDKEKQEFVVNKVIANSLEIVAAILESQAIRVDISAQEDVTTTGYQNEYGQVLLNILANARDVFVERNVEKPCITITLGRENGRSVLSICDNGGGISEDIMPKIFDPYFTTKDKSMGTGIGLYMSKVIIENNMNGRLTARNSAEGAEFIIEV